MKTTTTELRTPIRRLLMAVFAGSMIFAQANAASLSYDFSGSNDPDNPFLTLTLDDSNTPGSVQVSVDLAADIGKAQLSQLYLNLDPAFSSQDYNNLNFTYLGGNGPAANQVSFDSKEDGYKGGPSGAYDLRLDFISKSFGAGESLLFLLDGIDSLTVDSFDFLSIRKSGKGPWQAAAKFQSAGGGAIQNAWNQGQVAPVPVPASVWMLGSALGFLGWKGRQAHLSKQAV